MRVTTATVLQHREGAVNECPKWCASGHNGPFSIREEQVYRERAHFHMIGVVPKHPDDTEFTSVATVEVVRRDNVDTGAIGALQIYANTDYDLTLEQAEQFAAYVQEAVAFVKKTQSEVPANFARLMRLEGH